MTCKSFVVAALLQNPCSPLLQESETVSKQYYSDSDAEHDKYGMANEMDV